MEGFASLLALAALVAAWWLTAKKLNGKNWFLRHLAGSTVGVVVLVVVMTIFIGTGLVDPEDSASTTAADSQAQGSAEGDTRQAPQPAAVAPSYSIVSDEYLAGLKRTVEVALDTRVTEAELAAIAEAIKSQATRDTDRTFINYRVEGNTTGVYWATTHYDPDLNVKIIGMTASEAERAKGHQPRQFETVSQMMDEFGDYSVTTGQFQVISEQPLHIHLRPGVVEGERESAVHEELKRAVVYGIYKTMVHTPADQVRVTASPMIMTFQPVTLTPADSPVYDVSLTREQALAAVATFFPIQNLQELVTLQGSGGLTYEAWSPAFQALYYESHRPGLNAFFEELKVENKALR